MKKTFSAVTGIMLALMMLFVSCEQGGMSKAQIDSHDLVSVSFTKVEAKSVNVDSIGEVTTPALNTLYFQYKAVKTAGEGAENVQGQKTEWTNLGSQGLAQTIQLSRGNWTISLRGFATDALRTAAGTSDTASTQAVFAGSLSQDIGSDLTSRNESVNVSLDFTNPSGTGSYSLGVTIPASYASQQAKVKVTVTPASGNAQVQTYQFTSGTVSHTYEFSTVNNGIASVKVEYLDAADVAIGDAVTANTLIMTDMTTNGTASIAEDNTFSVSFAGTSVNGSAEESNSGVSAYSGKITDSFGTAITSLSMTTTGSTTVKFSYDTGVTAPEGGMSWTLENSSGTVIANYTGDSVTLSALSTGTYTLRAISGDEEDKVTVTVTSMVTPGHVTPGHSGGTNN